MEAGPNVVLEAKIVPQLCRNQADIAANILGIRLVKRLATFALPVENLKPGPKDHSKHKPAKEDPSPLIKSQDCNAILVPLRQNPRVAAPMTNALDPEKHGDSQTMSNLQSSILKRLAKYAPAAVAAAGIAATVYVAQQTINGQGIKQRLDFEKEAMTRAGLIEAQLQGNLQRLRAMTGFLASRTEQDKTLSESEFNSFIRQGLDPEKDVVAIYVIGDVPLGQEDAYVDHIRSSNDADWSEFKIRSPRGLADDRLISDRPGNRLLPLTYVWAPNDNIMRPGLDISELKNLARFVKKADQIRGSALVSIFFPDKAVMEPHQDGPFITRFSTILPIPASQTTPYLAARYVRMDFSMEALVERAIGALTTEDMSLSIINEDDRENRSFMPFVNGKRPQFGLIDQNLTTIEIPEKLFFTHSIEFPNSRWEMIFAPKPGHYEVAVLSSANIVFVGLLITLLLVSTTNLLLKRRDEILALVKKRTWELTVANAELQKRHAELAALNQDLKATTHEAQRASAAKSEFLATMSHEIRTPMNGVLGMASLLNQSKLDKDQKHKLSVITSSSQALLDILNDILDLSKVESGLLELENRPVDFDALLTELDHAWRPMFEAKGLNLVIQKKAWLSDHLVADATRLRQIFNNLISNALKFTETGEVRITLRQSERPSAEIVNHVSIQDTGIGIHPEALPQIFEQFTQADASTTRKYGGTGLGLAICKNLLEHMDGAIGADSKPDQGTTIWFNFPSRPAVIEKPSHQEEACAEDRFGQDDLPNALRILVAEDNAVNQQLMKALLSTLPYHFDLVQTGQEAVQAAKAGNYDVLLMDIQMPILDGMEATKQIRQLETPIAQIPIIAMTANALPGDKEKYLAAGMTDYISKPLNPSLLIDKTLKLGKQFRDERDKPTPARANAAGC